MKEVSIDEAVSHFQGYRYGDFKKEVADVVCDEMGPFQEKYQKIIDEKSYLPALREGAKRAKEAAQKTLKRVQNAVGLLDIDAD